LDLAIERNRDLIVNVPSCRTLINGSCSASWRESDAELRSFAAITSDDDRLECRRGN